MRHLLPHIALLALGLAERPQTYTLEDPRRSARNDAPRIGGLSQGYAIPAIQNEIPGSPIRTALRERRRWNTARKFATGHWPIAA